jgi:hypothetical protein
MWWRVVPDRFDALRLALGMPDPAVTASDPGCCP